MARRIDFVGRLDGKARTPQGGLRVGANLTRTGIFLYKDARGETVREYRPPEEVFKPESLDTLKLATLTVGHPEAVRTDNYTSLNVGVVAENVRASGIFVASDVLVQDQKTIDRVDSGELAELSCGYEVDLDRTPGTTPEGERYDAVQRNIRYNHVALGGVNWGRAGSDVRLHLDGGADEPVLRLDEAGDAVAASYARPMSDPEKTRADGLQVQLTAANARADQIEAKYDTAKAEIVDLKSKLDAAETRISKLIDPATVPALVTARVALEAGALKLAPKASFTKKDSAGNDVPMSDVEVMTTALAVAVPDAKLDGRSLEYITARFDGALERASKQDQAHAQLGGSIENATKKGEQPAKSRLDTAIENAAKEATAAAQAGPPNVAGSLTRK